MEWSSIETAPKHEPILGYTAEGICEIMWDYDEWTQIPCYSTYDGCGCAKLLCQPTHWMPLPKPPED